MKPYLKLIGPVIFFSICHAKSDLYLLNETSGMLSGPINVTFIQKVPVAADTLEAIKATIKEQHPAIDIDIDDYIITIEKKRSLVLDPHNIDIAFNPVFIGPVKLMDTIEIARHGLKWYIPSGNITVPLDKAYNLGREFPDKDILIKISSGTAGNFLFDTVLFDKEKNIIPTSRLLSDVFPRVARALKEGMTIDQIEPRHILGIPASASTADIFEANNRLQKLWHPDQFKTQTDIEFAQRVIRTIDNARNAMKNKIDELPFDWQPQRYFE